jgi:hypothetical protein
MDHALSRATSRTAPPVPCLPSNSASAASLLCTAVLPPLNLPTTCGFDGGRAILSHHRSGDNYHPSMWWHPYRHIAPAALTPLSAVTLGSSPLPTFTIGGRQRPRHRTTLLPRSTTARPAQLRSPPCGPSRHLNWAKPRGKVSVM